MIVVPYIPLDSNISMTDADVLYYTNQSIP